MKNKIAILLIFLTGTFVLSSCLKDDTHDYWKDEVAGKMYATIASPGFQSNSLLPVPDEVTISFLINIATDAVPSTSTQVSLALDNDAIAAYDSTLKAAAIAANDTNDDGTFKWKNYKPFPSVELLDPVITIPAGSRNAYARIKVARADTVQLAGNYMTAITITSVSAGIVIAENMKTVLFAFPIANEYEGDYLSEGFRDHPSLGHEPFKFSKLHFSTVNANTVFKDQVGNYGGYGLNITITDQTMVVAGVTVNKCTLEIMPGSGGMPGTWGVYLDYNGEPTNYYNPITRVFELWYYYDGSGGPRKLRETNSRL